MSEDSNMGYHAPETPITEHSLHMRMAAYDLLPRALRDGLKDTPVKLCAMGTLLRLQGGCSVDDLIAGQRAGAKKFYDASVVASYGEAAA